MGAKTLEARFFFIFSQYNFEKKLFKIFLRFLYKRERRACQKCLKHNQRKKLLFANTSVL